MVARAGVRENFVTIDQIHCKTCIFASLTLKILKMFIF